MKTTTSLSVIALVILAATVPGPSAAFDQPIVLAASALDSAGAEYPNVAQWIDATARTTVTRVEGESLDSGLGELPHYWKWLDKTGRDPMGLRAGESLDSGLGELPHYSKWVDKSGRDPMGLLARGGEIAKR